MSQIPALTASLLQTPQVQRQQSVQKDRQIRRQQQLAKNIALQDEQLEHQVESSEELTPIHEQKDRDQSSRRPPQRRRPHSQDEPAEPRLDITA